MNQDVLYGQPILLNQIKPLFITLKTCLRDAVKCIEPMKNLYCQKKIRKYVIYFGICLANVIIFPLKHSFQLLFKLIIIIIIRCV